MSLQAFLSSHHLPGVVIDIVRLAVWLVLLAAVFLPLERIFALRPRRPFCKSLVQDVGYYFINGLLPSVLLGVPLALVAYGARALVPVPVQGAVAAWPLWLRILAGLVVGEIGFYWGHRLAHRIPFLWRFHSVHHAAEELYFLVSARAHPFDNAFIRLCGLVPACVLGVASPLAPDGTLVPVLIVVIATVWGFVIHANLRWPLRPLRLLIATPAFHHWHHTKSALRDRNYASMLPWVDWIFGTYHVPRDRWPIAYGIDTPLPTSLAGQFVYPLLPESPQPAATHSSAVDEPQ